MTRHLCLLYWHLSPHNILLRHLVASPSGWRKHSTLKARFLGPSQCRSCCSPTLHQSLHNTLPILTWCISRFLPQHAFHFTQHQCMGTLALTLHHQARMMMDLEEHSGATHSVYAISAQAAPSSSVATSDALLTRMGDLERALRLVQGGNHQSY